MNDHLLADFRSQGGDRWDELLTQIVAALVAEGLVTMNRLAQDGMRVPRSRRESVVSSPRPVVRVHDLLNVEVRQNCDQHRRQSEEPRTELKPAAFRIGFGHGGPKRGGQGFRYWIALRWLSSNRLFRVTGSANGI